MTSITITEVQDHKVMFTSLLGNGVAIWVGELPQIGGCYHVELEVNDVFEWGENIDYVKEETSIIRMIEDELLFIAQVLSYEDDGVLTVSIGGEIIFLDVNPPPDISDYVSFSTSINNVSLYPVEF
ncbi:TPA: hypothetical protein QFV83_000888 [Klebsiella aerogenes]|nr:hypothetical protein [Klebsiella aerogenes]